MFAKTQCFHKYIIEGKITANLRENWTILALLRFFWIIVLHKQCFLEKFVNLPQRWYFLFCIIIYGNSPHMAFFLLLFQVNWVVGGKISRSDKGCAEEMGT